MVAVVVVVVVCCCRMLGHVSADDLVYIIQRDVLKADGAEGGLSVLWLLLNAESLPV